MIRATVWAGLTVMGFWWWRTDPDVEKGNAKAAEGKYDEALADYDRAEKELSGEEHRRALAFDRGLAHHGAGRLEAAQQSFAQAAQAEDRILRSRAAFNEGNVAMQRKDKRAATDAYTRSLRADPSFAPARRNLELLLTEPPPPPGDGGGEDGEDESGKGDGGQPDGGSGDGGQADGGQDDGQGRGGGDGGHSQDSGMMERQEDKNGAPPPQDVTEQDAMRILDAIRDQEKHRPLGRMMLRDDRQRRSTKEW